MLTVNPNERITISEILEHPWVTKVGLQGFLRRTSSACSIEIKPKEKKIDARTRWKKVLTEVRAIVRARKQEEKDSTPHSSSIVSFESNEDVEKSEVSQENV